MRVVNEIPNFTGVIASPRLRCGFFEFQFAKFFPARFEIAFLDQLLPNPLNAVVLDFLAVMRRVGLAAAAI